MYCIIIVISDYGAIPTIEYRAQGQRFMILNIIWMLVNEKLNYDKILSSYHKQ